MKYEAGPNSLSRKVFEARLRRFLQYFNYVRMLEPIFYMEECLKGRPGEFFEEAQASHPFLTIDEVIMSMKSRFEMEQSANVERKPRR